MRRKRCLTLFGAVVYSRGSPPSARMASGAVYRQALVPLRNPAATDGTRIETEQRCHASSVVVCMFSSQPEPPNA